MKRITSMILATVLSIVALGGLSGCGEKQTSQQEVSARIAESTANKTTTSAQFVSLAEKFALTYFDELPEQATYYGVPEEIAGGVYDNRLTTRSLDSEISRRVRFRNVLAEMRAIDPAGLEDGMRLSRDIFIDQLEARLGPADIVDWGQIMGDPESWFVIYPVSQMNGPHIDIANTLGAQQPLENVTDAENYLSRMSAMAENFDQTIEAINYTTSHGVIPPDFVIEKSLAVINSFMETAPAENAMATSLARRLEEAGIEGGAAYAAQAATIIETEIYPAYQRLATTMEALLPQASHDAGIWRLPNGEALYRAMIRHHADSLDMTAEEIHQIGLSEVARITEDMNTIMTGVGLTEGTVGDRMTAISEDPRFTYPNTEEGKQQIIDDLNTQIEGITEKLPQLFKTMPPQGVEVRRVPTFSEASAPGGYYNPPALDGSRPGIYWINLRDTAIWPKWTLPTLTYHEASPGHHFQIALSMAQDQPIMQSVMITNAFAEGWALYAEQLAKDMGIYEGDPYGDLGRLQAELHRAVRLVVDTGMHAKRWSRERAIQYMIDAEGAHPSEAESEIERYAVWPAQALGYKMGMLKIQKLRARAEMTLGAKFDIREFHDLVLLTGGAPLPVLEDRVNIWIAQSK